MRRCEYCGTPVDDEEQKCSACGAWCESVPEPEAETPVVAESADDIGKTVKKTFETDWFGDVVMAAITVLLGYFGVHRFLQGKVLSGALWALTCGFFIIGYIVDSVGALKKAVESFQNRDSRD